MVSWKGSQRFGLVQVVQSVEEPKVGKVESLVESYSDLFEGLGKLKGFQVHLYMDKSVQPVAQPPRRIPFHVRKKLEEQLLNDEKLGVIEETEGPTPLVSPVVVIPKKEGKVRVCVDMFQVNKSIKRERHITPTINEVINDLNGAKIFSKLDLNQGYNQLELAPESRYLTTFSTHLGLRQFRRPNKTSPATALFGCPVKTRLPQIGKELESHDDVVRENDNLAKLKMKHADRKSYVKPSLLEKGDTVLLKKDYKSKRFPPYESTSISSGAKEKVNGYCKERFHISNPQFVLLQAHCKSRK